MPAPSSITHSEAERKAAEINKARMPANPITQQEQDRRIAKSQLVQQLRKGDATGIQKAVQSGVIKAKDVPIIERKARLTPLQASVNTMSLDQIQQVMKKATPEEKRQLMPLVQRKQTKQRVAFSY
jgi:hypothetical protein